MPDHSRKTLETSEDIEKLVRQFYAKVRQDPFIGPIFEKAIGDHWEEHLIKIKNFWETLLLGSESYHGRPFPPHMALNLKPEHFKRWLELFFETSDALYEGRRADEIKMRALNIGRNFLANIQHFERQRGGS